MASLDRQVQGWGLPEGPDLDILLVGKTGNGKSSTANSIIDEDFFDFDAKVTSVTANVGAFQKEMDGRKLFVVDTPGLCDTSHVDSVDPKESEKAFEEAKRRFTMALSMTREGFHAILLVFKFGSRMTQEEADAIKQMKLLLGDDFIKNHGVLLMTCGETFEYLQSKKKINTEFELWCRTQGGIFKSVLEECQNRCVLFSNQAKDEQVLMKQRIKLIKLIDTMTHGQRYKGGIFKTIAKYYETGEANVDLGARTAYLNASTIYFRLVGLVRKTTSYDKTVIAEMRRYVEDLKKNMENVQGDVREDLKKQIEKAENEMNQLAEAIQASPTGQVGDHPAVEAFVAAVNGTMTVLAAPFFVAAGLISAVIIGIFKGIWAGAKMTNKQLRKCIIQ